MVPSSGCALPRAHKQKLFCSVSWSAYACLCNTRIRTRAQMRTRACAHTMNHAHPCTHSLSPCLPRSPCCSLSRSLTRTQARRPFKADMVVRSSSAMCKCLAAFHAWACFTRRCRSASWSCWVCTLFIVPHTWDCHHICDAWQRPAMRVSHILHIVLSCSSQWCTWLYEMQCVIWLAICVCSVNITLGLKEDRNLITGLHTVADVYCNCCQSILGWKYVRVYPSSAPTSLPCFLSCTMSLARLHSRTRILLTAKLLGDRLRRLRTAKSTRRGNVL